MVSKAILRFYRQSPRKVRLIAQMISGQSVEYAQSQLAVTPKRASAPILKLLNSAVANALQESGEKKSELTVDQLFIKEIRVDEGPTMKRFRPRAHGRASMIRKRTSHVTVILGKRRKKKKSKNSEAKLKK